MLPRRSPLPRCQAGTRLIENLLLSQCVFPNLESEVEAALDSLNWRRDGRDAKEMLSQPGFRWLLMRLPASLLVGFLTRAATRFPTQVATIKAPVGFRAGQRPSQQLI